MPRGAHTDPTATKAIATVESEEGVEEPITSAERREAYQDITGDRVRERRQERAREEINAELIVLKNKYVKEAKARAKEAVAARVELLPIFVEQLQAVAETAQALRAAKVAHSEAHHLVAKLGEELGVMWPYPPFAVDPKEREALRSALQAIQSIGGVV